MAWFVIAAMAASALASASQNRANANSTRAWTEYNLKVNKLNADWQAEELRRAGAYERYMAVSMANMNAQNIYEDAKLNASYAQKVGFYNSQLLRDEAEAVYEQLELDEQQLEKRLDIMSGNMRVAYAASGVMLDQDSPLQAEVSHRAEGALETDVMRYNANLKASKLLDAAALGQWETDRAVEQIMYEGKMKYLGATYGAAIQIGQQAMSLANQANVLQYNAVSQGAKISMTGVFQEAQYAQAATNALISGLFNTSSAVHQQYAATKIKNTYPRTDLYGRRVTTTSNDPMYGGGYPTELLVQ